MSESRETLVALRDDLQLQLDNEKRYIEQRTAEHKEDVARVEKLKAELSEKINALQARITDMDQVLA